MSKIKEISTFTVLFKLFSLLSPLYRKRDEQLLKKYSGSTPPNDPVFIIGAPRTGSTLLYQLITNRYNILYPDNLVHIFNENFQVGFDKSQKRFGSKPHNSFSSKAGRSKKLHAPSEHGDFWYRWIDRNNYHVAARDLTADAQKEIRNNLYAVMNRFDRQLIMKNLFLVERLNLIAEIFPKGKFIWIHRDPAQTAQSIYMMRKKLRIPESEWWSVRPSTYNEIKGLDLPERLITQVLEINKQIFEELNDLDDSRLMMTTYKDVCTSPDEVLKEVGDFTGVTQTRKNAQMPNLKFREEIRIDNSIYDRFKEISEAYPEP